MNVCELVVGVCVSRINWQGVEIGAVAIRIDEPIMWHSCIKKDLWHSFV